MIKGFPVLKRMMASQARLLDRYVWIDLELTGLDFNKDRILEIACIVSDTNLKPLNEGINLIINHPEDVLTNMNEWSQEHHEKTGLTESCRKSTISTVDAERTVFKYIEENSSRGGQNYIAGNSVYMDLMFIKKWMPSIDSLLHYRIIDVSSINILAKHWHPDEFNKNWKKKTHRALDDIAESMKELKMYKESLFK